MRTVSFVDNIEFSYTGNISGKALTVGDIDNDKFNELVIGNIDGEVLIFKGSDSKPWRKCTGLGMITCLEIGNICSYGMNYLLVLSEEGWCHIFSINAHHELQDPSDPNATIQLKAVHKQRLAANSMCLLIADIDGDGLCELVVGYTDRRVRSFRWTESGDEIQPQQESLTGSFVTLETWQLAGQIGSITLHYKPDGSRNLMVSQPGGTFVSLYSSNTMIQQEEDGENKLIELKEPSVIFHPLGSARARNPGVTTEVVADIRRKKRGDGAVDNYCAICTLDGTITLVDDADNILWSLYVDHQLFSLTKLDVTGDGSEEVVACSWDGQTYMVNLNKDLVRFQFPENVAAFCAGQYSADNKTNVPCLIYATFNNKIKVFNDIRMSQIGTTNLIATMEKEQDLPQLLDCLNCDSSESSQVRQLYRWCLYGFQPHNLHPKTRRDSTLEQPIPVEKDEIKPPDG